MDRRLLPTGLVAAVAAAPALAQQSNPNSPMPTGQGGSAGMAGSGSQLGQAEMQHIQQTLQLGLIALETSRIALQKANDANLKQFAQFEADEQTTLSQVLHTMMDPTATAAVGSPMQGQASQTGSSMSSTPNMAANSASRAPDSMLDAQGREMVQKLQQASGAAFDREYLQGQLQGHRNLLQVQERYLSSNPQNISHVNVVKLARGMIKEHIALLEDMQGKIR